MSDQNVKFTNDIKIISDSITVQIFSLFYHYFLTANNSYIEKYHDLMRVQKQNGERINSNSLDALFDVANTVPLADIKGFLNAAFFKMPETMLAEDELLPLEEEFFRDRYPQFRSLLLKENFPVKHVRLFRDRLISFSRLTDPALSEMETACREAEILLNRRNTAAAAGTYITDGTACIAADVINSQLFDVLFRYCICWQNLIDVLKNHARELYKIYHSFFTQGLFDKYSRFYYDASAMEPLTAGMFFPEFLETEILTYEKEFSRKADPGDPDDRQTLRDVCTRVEEFFKSCGRKKFY